MTRFHSALLLAAGLALASISAQAQTAPMVHDHAGGVRGFLSPEQRIMLGREMHQQLAGMSQDQRRAAHHTAVANLMAMTQSQREARRDQLQAEWNALPPAKKTEIEARIQQWAQRRAGIQGQ
ncbi:MAG TPA: hypothetical protein VGG10_07945 [Rhizomicrobium sp.]|jgi:hypothetical protein